MQVDNLDRAVGRGQTLDRAGGKAMHDLLRHAYFTLYMDEPFAGGPPKLDPVTAMKQKIRDYGYMHMDKWELLLSITAKAMLAAEVSQ